MSVLPIETRLVTALNIFLLILVALTPYFFDQVVSTVNPDSVREYASILFTIDLTATLLIMATFAHIIAQEEEHLVDGEIMVRFRRIRNRLILLAIVVLLSLAVPWAWLVLGIPIRILVWCIPMLSFWFNRMTRPPGGIGRVAEHQ
jgi:hypothetical protein